MEQTDSIDEREFEAAFHEAVANGSCIKWRYWVHQMPSLTAEQAARLMCGLDPDLFESLNSRPNRNDPGDLCKRARMIERLAIAEKHLADSAAGWLAWAKSRGFNVHDGFVLEVEAMNSAQADQEQPGPNPAPAAQVEPVRDAEVDRLNYSMLATPDELIEAFGRNTGMSKAWFGNLKDKPGLERARRVDGMKGRGGHKPLFCPLAVMHWLTNEKRKVGRPISVEKGWSLLESYFPRVYDAHASAAP